VARLPDGEPEGHRTLRSIRIKCEGTIIMYIKTQGMNLHAHKSRRDAQLDTGTNFHLMSLFGKPCYLCLSCTYACFTKNCETLRHDDSVHSSCRQETRRQAPRRGRREDG